MKKIGIIGGGQLGMMMARAAQQLNMKVTCLDPNPLAPAKFVAQHEVAEFGDQKRLLELSRSVDYLTYEFENVSVASLKGLAKEVNPSINLLEVSQHRMIEKQTLQNLGVQTCPFYGVSTLQELEQAAARLGFPFILKTCTLGYDGKGQFRIKTRDDFEEVPFGSDTQYIAEGFIRFDCEVSQVAVRDQRGEIGFYPLSKNTHKQGILTRCEPASSDLQDRFGCVAQKVTRSIMEKYAYVGILAVEFFCVGDQLLVNEIAPRVHNSGHWTLEGAVTSQFENHIRAISGLPIGSTKATVPVVLFNIIGRMPVLDELLKIDGCNFFGYLKSERTGRKIGHITLVFPTEDKIAQVESLIT